MADDISEFEIEGMSIGDSLLKFFNKKTIDENKVFYKSNKFYQVSIDKYNFQIYDGVNFQIKNNDNNYIIYSLSGVIKKDIKKCLRNQKQVLSEIKSLFNNPQIIDEGKREHAAYENSFTYDIYVMVNNDMISVSCYDMNDNNFSDVMLINVDTAEFNDFLNNEAHN
tara:strand:+ start:1388 stop:1888 length:501 start_codon:yes stop_codon:yes gene_type:complete